MNGGYQVKVSYHVRLPVYLLDWTSLDSELRTLALTPIKPLQMHSFLWTPTGLQPYSQVCVQQQRTLAMLHLCTSHMDLKRHKYVWGTTKEKHTKTVPLELFTLLHLLRNLAASWGLPLKQGWLGVIEWGSGLSPSPPDPAKDLYNGLVSQLKRELEGLKIQCRFAMRFWGLR
jgi:hypothetical protein